MQIPRDINIYNFPQATAKDVLADDDMDGVEASFSTASYSTECVIPQTSSDVRPLLNLPKGKDRSTEKLMNATRRVHKVSFTDKVYRDDVDAISDQFAQDLQSKVVRLTIAKFDEGVDGEGKANEGKCGVYRLEGQGGFLLFPGETSNAVFATAKHNLSTEFNEVGKLQLCRGHFIESHQGIDTQINIPGCGWNIKDAKPYFLRDGSYWNPGFDVSIGPRIDDDRDGLVAWTISTAATPYDVVKPNFVFKVGMKIGIVVYSMDGAAASETSDLFLKDFALDKGVEISDIYGAPECVVVYTGQITRVGENYFEHDINTFHGCSGAIVFLLDQQQPKSVSSKDYQKAVGVHAGHNEELGVNIAFSLIPGVKRSILGCICRIFSG